MTTRIHTAAAHGFLATAVGVLCLACSAGQNASTGSSAHSTALTGSVPAATSSSPGADPVFDGLYLQFVDGPHSTYNGAPRSAGQPITQWWAFRSACMPAGCVATSTKLNDANTNVAEMPPNQRVYHFVNGAWEWAQDDEMQCQRADGAPAAGSTKAHHVTRLMPQPDGSLAGKSITTALDDGCKDKGAVTETPTTYTRKGEVPPDIPMIDPTKAG
jgi:serine/threonine-protein kinase